ncbi:MAG: methionine--tRNA ligase [Candidatus Micrarchaeota archaeon]|nr:MAG: methionine--tRNA ligase [Candidatus Micrarchaeota archaeon]
MDKSKYIVTSALPYAEAIPHIGNLVGSILPADIFYRYIRFLKGEDAIFICGSDQHGTPIEIQAYKKGVEPKELAYSMHNKMKELFERFNIAFSYYGYTDSEENKRTVYEIFDSLYKNGYIVETEIILPFCKYDNKVLSDRFVIGKCPYCGFDDARGDQCDNCGRLLTPDQLIDPRCNICKRNDIEFIKSKNLAVNLTALQDQIKDFIEANKDHNWSKAAVNKSLSYIKEGLKPRDITRDIEWGFPVNLKGYESKRFYVWFDALIGYIGITKQYLKERYVDYWKDRSTKLIQFMGKDNIEFHALLWPGILIGSKSGFILPYTIKSLEYLNIKGGKFSKSRGKGINIEQALDIMDSDYWRFILAYIMPETADSEISVEIIEEAVNSILNNKIGNLFYRVLSIAKRDSIKNLNIVIDDKAKEYIKRYEELMDKIEIREALRLVMELADITNSYINDKRIWDIRDKDKLIEILNELLGRLYAIAVMLYPFIPSFSQYFLGVIGVDDLKIESIANRAISIKLDSIKIPFSKLNQEQIDKLKERLE